MYIYIFNLQVMSQDRSESELSNMSSVVPDAIRRATIAAAVEPVTSMDELTQQATQDTNLHSAFEDQIHQAVQDRVKKDTDYIAEKFPQTEKYLGQYKK